MAHINISYENKDYELEYSRQTVKTMEAQGFVLEEISTKPATMIPMLFQGAFLKNHRGIKRALIDDIYNALPEKSELLNALIEMYGDTLSTLTNDAAVEGNATWTVSR